MPLVSSCRSQCPSAMAKSPHAPCKLVTPYGTGAILDGTGAILDSKLVLVVSVQADHPVVRHQREDGGVPGIGVRALMFSLR